jgi:putative spermidine/putrescine transport system ATP-binding protein
VRLQAFAERLPKQLSGGQQQRVALARAIVIRPDILLLDEPLSALDAKLRDEMRNEIRELQTRLNLTTLFVTHDQSEALSMADRVVVMNEGKIEQVGTPREIYETPVTRFVANFIGRSNFIAGKKSGTVFASDLGVDIHSSRAITDDIGVVAVRPESIRIVPRGQTVNDNVVPGTIKTLTYLGPVISALIDVAAGKQLVVECPATNRPSASWRLATRWI